MVIGIGVKIGAANSVAVVASERAWREPVVLPTEVPDGAIERVGDPVPLIDVDGTAVTAADVHAGAVAVLLAAVDVDPDDDQAVVVAHPDTWSETALDDAVLAVAAHPALAGTDVVWVPESAAAVAAIEHSCGSFDDAVVVTYDLGATGITVGVVDAEGGELRSRPLHLDSVSGREFDRLLLTEMLAVTEVDGARVGVDELVELRSACASAKERLSVDTETAVGVRLDGAVTEARLVRDDVEELLRGPILESVSLVREAVADAGVDLAQVSAVLVTGGGAAIPLVNELLSSSLRIPVLTDPDPVSTTAAGAALLAQRVVVERQQAGSGAADSDLVSVDVPAPPTIRDLAPAPSTPVVEPKPRLSRGRRGALVLAGTAAAVAITAGGLSMGTGLFGSTGTSEPPPAGAATSSAGPNGKAGPASGAGAATGSAANGAGAQGGAGQGGSRQGAAATGNAGPAASGSGASGGNGSPAGGASNGGASNGGAVQQNPATGGGAAAGGGSTGTGNASPGGGSGGGSTAGDGGDTSGGGSGGSGSLPPEPGTPGGVEQLPGAGNLPKLPDVGNRIAEVPGNVARVPGAVLDGAGGIVCSVACSSKSG